MIILTHTWTEFSWCPCLIPFTGWYQKLLHLPIRIEKAAIRSTGVLYLSKITQISIPLPGSSSWSFRRFSAINSWNWSLNVHFDPKSYPLTIDTYWPDIRDIPWTILKACYVVIFQISVPFKVQVISSTHIWAVAAKLNWDPIIHTRQLGFWRRLNKLVND